MSIRERTMKRDQALKMHDFGGFVFLVHVVYKKLYTIGIEIVRLYRRFFFFSDFNVQEFFQILENYLEF